MPQKFSVLGMLSDSALLLRAATLQWFGYDVMHTADVPCFTAALPNAAFDGIDMSTECIN